MSWGTFVKNWGQSITAVSEIIAIIAAAISFIIFFIKSHRKQKSMKEKIKLLENQNKSLKMCSTESLKATSQDIYNQLLNLSSQAAQTIGADIHSISIPVPENTPSHLRIILSTDPNSEKVIGKEIPVSKGIAGFAFTNKHTSFVNDVKNNKLHYDVIDKAAGTNTGEGAILTHPLLIGSHCHGIIQFMKTKGKTFSENDVILVSEWIPKLSRLVIDLEKNPSEAIPSIVRGNTLNATILFSDIGKFSEIASKIRLETSAQLLNEYYTRLYQYPLKRGGILQEYVGDGLYIIFSNEIRTSAAQAAVESAIEMQSEFNKMICEWKQYGLPISEKNSHSIGIATGIVYNGILGHPHERKEKIVGSAINLSSHLCEESSRNGGGILICSETASLLENVEMKVKPIKLSLGQHFKVL